MANDDLRDFLVNGVRRAWLLVVQWIDNKYNLPAPTYYHGKVELELRAERLARPS